MNLILSIAMAVTLLTSVIVVARWGNLILKGPMPTSLFAFCAILFTSGLDVGLIMFPLTGCRVWLLGFSGVGVLLSHDVLFLRGGTSCEAV